MYKDLISNVMLLKFNEKKLRYVCFRLKFTQRYL